MNEKAFPMSSIVPPGPDCLGFVWPLFLYENLSGQPLIVEVTAVSGFGGGGGGGGGEGYKCYSLLLFTIYGPSKTIYDEN